MFKKYRDLICGFILICLGAGVYAASLSIRSFALNEIKADFFPRLLAGAFIVLGAVIGVKGMLSARTFQAADDESREPFWKKEENQSTVLSLALIVAYIYCLKPVGFPISTFFYLVLQMTIMAPKSKLNKKTVLLFVLIALVASFGLYYIFTRWLYLMLPQGFLYI